MADGPQEGRQPGDDGVAAALDAQSQSRGEDGRAQQRRLEDRQRVVADAGRLVGAPGCYEQLRLLDEAADVQHQQRRGEPDPEDRAPGIGVGQHGEEQGREQGGAAPADGIAALDRADRLAAMGRPDDLAHQHGAGSPFAAEAQALQAAHDQQLVEAVGEAAQKGEERVPQHGELHHLDAAEPVAQHAADPAADRRGDEGGGAEQPGLDLADAPGRDQGRDQEAEHLHVHGIERPAAEAAPERPFLPARQLAVPCDHVLVLLGRPRSGSVIWRWDRFRRRTAPPVPGGRSTRRHRRGCGPDRASA